jgi:hypothetical protein
MIDQSEKEAVDLMRQCIRLTWIAYTSELRYNNGDDRVAAGILANTLYQHVLQNDINLIPDEDEQTVFQPIHPAVVEVTPPPPPLPQKSPPPPPQESDRNWLWWVLGALVLAALLWWFFFRPQPIDYQNNYEYSNVLEVTWYDSEPEWSFGIEL